MVVCPVRVHESDAVGINAVSTGSVGLIRDPGRFTRKRVGCWRRRCLRPRHGRHRAWGGRDRRERQGDDQQTDGHDTAAGQVAGERCHWVSPLLMPGIA